MSFKSYLGRCVRYILHGIPVQNTYAKISYLSPSKKLLGKNIVITGGGRGLGLAMAKHCIDEGANVLIAGRNLDTLKKSASALGCKYLTLDVCDVSSFENFFLLAEKELKSPVDCLINNAGISLHEPSFLDVSVDKFNVQINTNFKGAFFMTQKFVECYKKHSLTSGNVVFISSETSTTVDERPYGLTKAAINSLVQGLAFRYIKDGIRINAVAPGITSSDMTGYKADGNLFACNHVTNRIFLPEEVAEIVTFLLSDASNCLNGQILVCNEGNTINARWK